MRSEIYKLTFPKGVHFGNKDITETEIHFCVDRLFSALFLESLKMGGEYSQKLLQGVQEEKLLISDSFPYIGERLYIPKPFLAIQREKSDVSSTRKKAAKKLKYLPADKVMEYLAGDMEIEKEVEMLRTLGKKEEKVCASILGEQETKPYRVAIFRFNEECGLYVCVRTSGEEYSELFMQLLSALQFSGIGGERSSGYGRFTFQRCRMPEYLEKRFEGIYDQYMALSCCMAGNEELDVVVENACYQLQKRSGFTDSGNKGEQEYRKKDFYVFAAGSCFSKKFAGDIFDVSRNGIHPVYRYAKGMWIGVT